MGWRRGLILIGFLLTAGLSPAAAPIPVPTDLPRYDLNLEIHSHNRSAKFRETITWTNTSHNSTNCLVLNFYPHYRLPEKGTLLFAKTLELLRLSPSDAIEETGRCGSIDTVNQNGKLLSFHYREENVTAVVIELPAPVAPKATVTVTVEGTIPLPRKQGRWGCFGGITFLSNAVPVVAFFDDRGWHDVPFVPWHQPFWNEAGVYTATIDRAANQVLACSAEIAKDVETGDGRKIATTKPFVGRDFTVLCSEHYREEICKLRVPDGREITLRCLSHPEHGFYAKELLKMVATAIPVYSEWLGPFPNDQLTIAESYFGWNGNECAGLIMIDERVFDMPQLARGYVEYLVSHETCHQWWYNQVGTNGYGETFMDEGAATHFAHKLLDKLHGKNNPFLDWPTGLKWMPNIHRDNYRNSTWYGAVRRDDAPAAIGTLAEFENLARLFSGAYDRGSKIFGLIEARLGEAAFVDFTRELVRKYSFRVLSAEQLQSEIVAYCGHQTIGEWDAFFKKWVYSNDLTDWSLDHVRVAEGGPRIRAVSGAGRGEPVRLEIECSQRRELDEPTILGIEFAPGDGFPIRIPLGPTSIPRNCEELDAKVLPTEPGRCVVRITLPEMPSQIVIDPDRLLLDANPGNNAWHRPPKVTLTPFYTFIYDTNLTGDYDRWNLTAGPWAYGAFYQDPWYTRTSLMGLRAGAFRTETFYGGAYAAYRSDFRDLVVGVDGLFDHIPFPKTQIGFNYEHRIGGPYGGSSGRETAQRGVLFGRYVFRLGSSMYLPPISYLDVFGEYQDNFLPFARNLQDGAVRPNWMQLTGAHYRLNLYTPYWDPERGVWVDLVAGGGVTNLGNDVGTAQLRAELATVQKLPESMGYFSNVRLAGRVVVQGAFPGRGAFFALGGSTLFRGFDLAERQGSLLWAANAEARVPVATNLRWNYLDSTVGVRTVTVAGFYDVGNTYTNGNSADSPAHALGVGLRLDLAFFSFIERAAIRFDVAKTINASSPVQFWFGIAQPF